MTYRLGLIARDIHNSVTPIVYKTFASNAGIDIDFEIFNVEPEKLDETVAMARETLDGFNVTMPYKRKILEYADAIDTSAEQCGSANVIKTVDGKFTAYNTDGWGLIKALALEAHEVAGKHVVLVGAGGVALSIAYHLSVNNVGRVDVINLIYEEGQLLCDRFGDRFFMHLLNDQALNDCSRDADIFINACVLGQVGYDDYQDVRFLKQLKKDSVVYDVNYSKEKPNLLEGARSYGLDAYNGKSMTACQGIRAMEIWTGKSPSDDAARHLIAMMQHDK